MTSGRDEAKKRRGRGKADEGPIDDELGWLADLRSTRGDRTDFGAGGAPGGPPPRDRPVQPPRQPDRSVAPPRQPDRESSIDLPARPRPARREPAADPVPRRAAREEPLDVPAGPRLGPGRPQSLADAPPPVRQPPPAPSTRAPRPSPAPTSQPPSGPKPPAANPVPPNQTPSNRPAANPAPPNGRHGANAAGPDRTAESRVGPPPGGRHGANPAGAAEPRRAVPPGRQGSPPRDPRSSGEPGSRAYLPPPRPSAGRVGGMQGIDVGETTVLPLGSNLMRQLQLRQVSRLRTATFVLLILAVVGAPAAFFVIREFTRDPVFVELDNLDVPQWAAGKHTDGAIGSRWCIRECRSRSRTWESARGPEETNRAYVAALKRAGWVPWNIPDCQAEGVDGVETCWQRDEYVLDLWVRPAVCDVKVRPTVGASGKPPSTVASAPAQVGPSDICPAAIASIKVYNRISYQPGG